MYRLPTSPNGTSGRLLAAAAFLIVCSACGEDAAAPSAPAEQLADPAEPSAVPTDLDDAEAGRRARSNTSGIVFASVGISNGHLGNVHTGWMAGGALSPKSILQDLSGARAKGGRVVIKLSKGRDTFVKNGDGNFSLTKWKALVGAYKNVNLGPYISDGTIIGHYLIDEPHRPQRWGGKGISHQTLEEMAKFSKQLWPQMPTLVRVVPSWLAGARFTYKYVDAGWLQYTAQKGDARRWVTAEAAVAKREGLGLVVGLNVLNGGNGSSKIRGATRSKWAMSATELRNYGGAMLDEPLACGFFMWTHDPQYYGRSDIKSAMASLSAKAKAHAKTSCRQ